jgi:hypothetical protein
MTLERPPEVDGRLRDAFRGDDAAATRVVRGAFARAERPVPRATWWRYAVLPAAAVVVMLVVLLVQPRPAPVEPAESPALSGSLIDGVLVVDLPDGSVSITDAGIRDDRPDGFGIVFVEGEPR